MIPVISTKGFPDKSIIMKQFRKFLPHALEQKLTRNRNYQTTIDGLLPKEYQGWVKLGNISQTEMTLVVSRQSIAGNLRFYGENIITAMLTEHGLGIEKIRVRVSPENGKKSDGKKARKRPRLPNTPAMEENRERLRKLISRL